MDLTLKMARGAAWSGWLGAFLRWWKGQLIELLPEGIRRSVMASEQRVVILVHGQEVVLSRVSLDGREALGRFPLPAAGEPGRAAPVHDESGRSVVLCLPPALVLQRELSLPLAAEENLREVLGFEMDRHTPFSAQQVYYDYRVLGRRPRQRMLDVALFVAPRESVDELAARVSMLGYTPSAVTVPSHCEDDPVNLLPRERRVRRPKSLQRLNIALGVVAALLLAAALWLPLAQKRAAIRALEPLLVSARAEAEEAVALRQKFDALEAESQFLVQKRQRTVPVAEVLNEITHLLPDDTWLNTFELRDGSVQIRGESEGAALLIPLLEPSPLLGNVQFRSPVTQNPRGGERFHISADLQHNGAR